MLSINGLNRNKSATRSQQHLIQHISFVQWFDAFLFTIGFAPDNTSRGLTSAEAPFQLQEGYYL